MAWDKNRPYAPFWNRKDLQADTYGSMELYDAAWAPIQKKEDIDRIWAGEEVVSHTCVYRPVKDVRLRLRLKRFEAHRAAGVFWWADEQGKSYPMFATEFNRLVSDGTFRLELDGYWSAMKRGANYGIALTRLAD